MFEIRILRNVDNREILKQADVPATRNFNEDD